MILVRFSVSLVRSDVDFDTPHENYTVDKLVFASLIGKRDIGCFELYGLVTLKRPYESMSSSRSEEKNNH